MRIEWSVIPFEAMTRKLWPYKGLGTTLGQTSSWVRNYLAVKAWNMAVDGFSKLNVVLEVP
jgi:hypothetical protein